MDKMPQMLDSLAIRRVQPSDLAALATFLEKNNTAEVRRYFSPFPLDEHTARRLCREDHRDLFFVAICGDEIIGLSMLRGWEEGFDVPSVGILIDRSYTGLGLGRRRTECTLNKANDSECARVRLSVYATNVRAVELYRSVGFVEIERHPVRFGRESDEKIVMTKALST